MLDDSCSKLQVETQFWGGLDIAAPSFIGFAFNPALPEGCGAIIFVVNP
jgi:hypothetical protein